jgi:Rad3-related DNA helicase
VTGVEARDVERLAELAEKATPGPWTTETKAWAKPEVQGSTDSEVHRADMADDPDGCIIGCWYDYAQTSGGLMSGNDADAEFIAAARNLLPALAQEWLRLKRVEEVVRRIDLLAVADEAHRLPTLARWMRDLNAALGSVAAHREEQNG